MFHTKLRDASSVLAGGAVPAADAGDAAAAAVAPAAGHQAKLVSESYPSVALNTGPASEISVDRHNFGLLFEK